MAFNTQKFVRTSAGEYSNDQVQADFKYNGTAENTKAEIIAADYFLPIYSQLAVGSIINFSASDAVMTLAYVTAVSSTTVTISEITETLPPGSVDTADLADLCVTTPKIALLAVTNAQMAAGAALANLAPASVTGAKIAAATVTATNIAATVGIKVLSGGGAATAATSTAFTVTGTLATDKAYATMTAGFSQPIVGVVCTANTVTVHYAAAALVTDTVDISVFRGAA